MPIDTGSPGARTSRILLAVLVLATSLLAIAATSPAAKASPVSLTFDNGRASLASTARPATPGGDAAH